jgi:hypothetical protein
VELLPAPDKMGIPIICTADNSLSPAVEVLANYAESGVSS